MTVTDRVAIEVAAQDAAQPRSHGHGLARAVAVLGLGVTAVVHAPLVPEHWDEIPYLGVAFAVLVVSAAALAGSLLLESSRVAWALALALTVGAVVLYVASRTVGLPLAGDEVGDWADVSGVVAVAAELVVAACALTVPRRRRSTR